jgi:DNA (cytosine-5)-methyltransferase 1
MSLRLFGSLFSGAGLLDHALERVGWKCLWQCESDPVARRVLARHWPDLECYHDVCTLDPGYLPAVDLLAGGFPCQDVSTAGCRAGLAGERSGLFFQFVRLADVLSPRWLLLENVFGLLSSAGGEDLATVIGEITGCRPQVPKEGWRNAGFAWGPKRGLAWRVLDAQYVGGCPLHADEWGIGPVPQRRRRVFLVAHSGDVGGVGGKAPRLHGSRLAVLPVQVLFESDSGAGYSAPSTEERSDVAPALRSYSSSLGSSAFGRGEEDDCNLVTFAELGSGHISYRPVKQASSLRASSGGGSTMINLVANTLRPEVCGMPIVRRLTPLEYLRLMGMPDDWLDLDLPLSDSAKYRLVGNGCARPVVEWIGRRILEG